MALIKCRGCGQMISDKAECCPKCGSPVVLFEEEPEVEQEKDEVEAGYEYEEEETVDRRKYWIIASVAVVVLLLVVGVWAFLGKSDAQANDDVVEITPEFIDKISKYDILAGFSEGMAIVLRDDKYGYINTKGDEAIPCQYDKAENFTDGFAIVSKDYNYGFIDTKGDSITPCQYERACPFSEERAAVCKDGKWGYVNTKGEEVVPCTYPNVELLYTPGKFSEGVACQIVNDDGLVVFITPEGKEIPELSNKFYVRKESAGSYDVPSFINGECGRLYTSLDPSDGEAIAIDKAGNVLGSERNDVWENAYYATDSGDTLYSDKSTVYIRSSITDDELRLLGVKDAYGNDVVKPKYHVLGKFSNGVALVGFIVDQIPGIKSVMVLGYMDMKGNDTFSYINKVMTAEAEDSRSDAEIAGLESGVRSVDYHAESEWNIHYNFDQSGMLTSYGYSDECENSKYIFVNGALVYSSIHISEGYDSETEEQKVYAYYYNKVADDHVIVYQKDMVTAEKTKFADIYYDGKGRIKSVNEIVIKYGSDNKPYEEEGGLLTADLAVIGRNMIDAGKFRRTMYGNELAWVNDNYEYLEIKNW